MGRKMRYARMTLSFFLLLVYLFALWPHQSQEFFSMCNQLHSNFSNTVCLPGIIYNILLQNSRIYICGKVGVSWLTIN